MFIEVYISATKISEKQEESSYKSVLREIGKAEEADEQVVIRSMINTDDIQFVHENTKDTCMLKMKDGEFLIVMMEYDSLRDLIKECEFILSVGDGESDLPS